MEKKNKFNAIMAKIKNDNIKPVPKWQCQLLNWSFWLAAAVAIVLSSIFFSIILINLFEIPLEAFQYMQIGHYLRVVFGIFPFAWLLLVLVSLVLGLVAFHKTKHGYRYNFILLISGLLTIVMVMGFILHGSRISQPLRVFTENRMPRTFGGGPFNRAQNKSFIDEGWLGGEIIDQQNNKILIKNLLNEEWEVFYDNKTKIKKLVSLEIGDSILVLGEREGELSFKAFVIKKIEGCSQCRVPKDHHLR